MHGPRRIVCLSDETTETLYGLGASERIVGISAHTRRPAAARRDKPVVSAFSNGSVERILALDPDLVLGFSDVQADLAQRLIRAGLDVMVFNQRSIAQILKMMETLGMLVDRAAEARAWTSKLRLGLDQVRARYHDAPRPRVYFEEWYDPMICGIRWVSELIDIAGGQDLFAARAMAPASRDRQISMEDLRTTDPEVMLVSWCGAPFDATRVTSRPGFDALSCAREGNIAEIPSSIILQPGPASLDAGLAELCRHLDRWRGQRVGTANAP